MVQKILAAVCSMAMFAVAPGSAEASNGAVIAPSTEHRDSRIGPILGASVVNVIHISLEAGSHVRCCLVLIC